MSLKHHPTVSDRTKSNSYFGFFVNFKSIYTSLFSLFKTKRPEDQFFGSGGANKMHILSCGAGTHRNDLKKQTFFKYFTVLMIVVFVESFNIYLLETKKNTNKSIVFNQFYDCCAPFSKQITNSLLKFNYFPK